MPPYDKGDANPGYPDISSAILINVLWDLKQMLWMTILANLR